VDAAQTTTQARRAEERRHCLAAFGFAETVRYGRITMAGTPDGTVRYELAVILPDGREIGHTLHQGTAQAEWPDPYVVTFYGVFGALPAQRRPLRGLPVAAPPVFSLGTQEDVAAGYGDLPFHWLWATVRYGASPIVGVLRAHPDPDEPFSDGLDDLQRRHTKADRDRAYAGIALLRARAAGKELTRPTAEEFLRHADDALADLRRAGIEPDPDHLIGQLPWEKSWVYELLEGYRKEDPQGRPWATMRALLRRGHRGSLAADDDERTPADKRRRRRG